MNKKIIIVVIAVIAIFVITSNINIGFFARQQNPEEAVAVAEQFAAEVLISSQTDKISRYIHSAVSDSVSVFENFINGFNLFGGPEQLQVYGYQILPAQQGNVLVLLKGSNAKQKFYYVVVVRRDKDDHYRVVDFARTKGELATNDEQYETPKSYIGQLYTTDDYPKPSHVVKRESLLHPFGNEPIKFELSNGQVISITAVAQRVLQDPQGFYLVYDYITESEPNSDSANNEEIGRLWQEYIEPGLDGTQIKLVQIRMFFDKYEFGKAGYKFYAQVYDFDVSHNQWKARKL